MIIGIASGKGGTGKTTVAVNLAYVRERVHYMDCDVEGPNGHLFLKPEIDSERDSNILVPELIKDRCTYCGVCAEVCAYNAIFVAENNWTLFRELCHGCGSCTYFCPEKALKEVPVSIGTIREGRRGNIIFTGGELNIGEAMSPPLIRDVKRRMNREMDVIIDAPPGTTCPAIEGIKDSDFVILVAEPTSFGLEDLKLMVEVVKKLNIPFGIFLNKKGMGGEGIIESFAESENIEIVGELPFDRTIGELTSRGEIISRVDDKYKEIFLNVWKWLEEHLERDSSGKR